MLVRGQPQEHFGLLQEDKATKQKEKEKRAALRQNFQLQKQSIARMQVHFLKSSLTEARRRPCLYCLAFMSIFMVVLTSCVSQTIISSMPLIFKSQAESANGQVDALVRPNNSSDLFNFTKIQTLLEPQMRDQVVVRTSTNGSLTTQSACPVVPYQYQLDKYAQNSSLMQIVSESLGDNNCRRLQNVQVMVLDTLREKQIGLGEWEYDQKISKGGCIMSQALGSMLSIKEGDIVFIKISLPVQLKQLSVSHGQQISTDEVMMTIPLRVDKLFSNIGMKVPEGQIQVQSMFIESESFLDYAGLFMQNGTNPLSNSFQQYVRSQSIQQYGSRLVFNYGRRDLSYIQSNYDAIQSDLISFGSQITESLGFFAVQLELPLLKSLFSLRFVSLFFGLIINMIIFILLLLSIILIYSLLLVTVETKSFDLGIVRILGLNKVGIIAMIVTQCFSYVLPALVCGLGVSLVVLDQISKILKSSVNASISAYPSDSAVLFSCGVGIIIPICSCVVPVRIALQQQLSEALDSSRNKTKAIQIRVQNQNYTVSENRIYFSLLSTFFGVSIYFLLPLSLLSYDIGLMLAVFFAVLIGMLMGAVLLTVNVQYLFEKLVVNLFFVCYRPAIKDIIIKNLAAHRIRNRRTGLMYSISLAFVIFLLVSFQLSIKFSIATRMQRQGAELVLQSDEQSIHLGDYSQFIQDNLKDYIKDVAYSTFDLESYMLSKNKYSQFTVKVTHLGRLFQYSPLLHGVSPNYLSIVYPEFLRTSVRHCQECALTLSEQLYTAGGGQRAVLANVYYDKLDLVNSPEQSFFIRIQQQQKNNFQYQESWYQYKMLATATSFSGFRFSKSPSRTSQPILMSLPSFLQLANLEQEQNVATYQDLPIAKLLFELTSSSKENKQKIKNALQGYMNQRGDQYEISDISDYEQSMQKQEGIINILFSTITYIVMFLCYFSLVSAMTANIYEQTKEIAVYRALGLTKGQMISIYKYEAFVLVFSSSVMGLLVGTLIGFMMTMQRGLFTDLPLTFLFPLQNFIVILLTSILVSWLSTRQSAHHIMNKQISDISRLTF